MPYDLTSCPQYNCQEPSCCSLKSPPASLLKRHFAGAAPDQSLNMTRDNEACFWGWQSDFDSRTPWEPHCIFLRIAPQSKTLPPNLLPFTQWSDGSPRLPISSHFLLWLCSYYSLAQLTRFRRLLLSGPELTQTPTCFWSVQCTNKKMKCFKGLGK